MKNEFWEETNDEIFDYSIIDDEYAKKQCELERTTYERLMKLDYDKYFTDVLVKEQPYYRCGMSNEEIVREIEYINNNLVAFYDGIYEPLWKQALK